MGMVSCAIIAAIDTCARNNLQQNVRATIACKIVAAFILLHIKPSERAVSE